MAKDAVYSGEREVRTFVDLNHGANVLLQKSLEDEKGSYYTTMASLLMRAFTFEAYLNHLGSHLFDFWPEIESIKVLDKYAALCKHLGITTDFSKRPYQTLSALFKFRNAIAHGKSVILEESKEVSSKDEPHRHTPKAHWEEYCTESNAKRAEEDVSAIIKEMHEAAELGDYPFIHGVGVGSISLKPAQQTAARDRVKKRTA
ncbi:hypothetical protein EVC37_14315 [Methylocaldum sp. BRCS4]|jgi:hypothetical protein|uniref:hypothetical protein n=1 Tax=Methylocaldum sp. 14B TaxID=1912213 RepID=UPI000989BC23|nr:hypothetical protein [Methylocaldum sp. 14B]MVF22778.1 hypothetical protein [Methylocaldum sp. BRCS4]